jgi:chemotaxis protein methyltransferase WspC
VGAAVIERAVRERCAVRGAPDIAAYWDQVKGSSAELQQLIERVIVPETWFFRDSEAFKALSRLALSLSLCSDRRLRILSIPCSTGEEPYSMAMTLLDGGVPSARFHIDALDICTRSIATAQRGTYGSNSFRGKDLEFRNRHFVQVGNRHVVSDTVRSAVRFRHGNLFDPNLLADESGYDFIFCRNMLIYFGEAEQAQAVRVLDKLLLETGVLFVGPSEGGVLIRKNMVSASMPLAFAFRKAAPGSASKTAGALLPGRFAASRSGTRPAEGIAWTPKPPTPMSRLARKQAPHHPAPAQRQEKGAPASSTATGAGPDYDPISAAARLADQGQLQAAAEICKRHMQAHKPTAAAYYLLGLISDAAGHHNEAREHYRKTLYLNPQHTEALVHLAALLDMDGDAAGARRMNDRARRTTPKRLD